MNRNYHRLALAVSVTAVMATCLLLHPSFGRTRQPDKQLASVLASRTPVYTPGNFTFTPAQELTGHPPSPAFFQQDAEPEITIDIFGNIYVTAIQGVPGGTDLWKSTDKGASFAFLGQPEIGRAHV